MKKLFLFLAVFFTYQTLVVAQYSTFNAHSHNDYAGVVPFWNAWHNHFGSIEADIWAVDGNLIVAHDKKDIKASNTIDALYIEPIVKLFKNNGGRAWYERNGSFQLLVDLKTPADPTLGILAAKLAKYPEVFDPSVNPNAVRVVISGNRPELVDYGKYPSFIFFDGLLDLNYTSDVLIRVPLFSENLARFTAWKGNGPLPGRDLKKLTRLIDSLHTINKKVRFWNAPDGENAWRSFQSMGVDYINTDKVNELGKFLEGK